MRLFKAPSGPTAMPPGSGPGAQGFQASRRYLMQQLIVWGGGFAAAIIGEVLLFVFEGTDAEEILDMIPFIPPIEVFSFFPIVSPSASRSTINALIPLCRNSE